MSLTIHSHRTRVLSLLGVGLVTALALSACSAGSTPAATTAATGSANLSIALGANGIPNSLDPDPTGGVSAKSPLSSVLGYLYSYNGETGESVTLADLKPDLAESITPSADGLSYAVVLRKGVKSPTGNELTTADVQFSIDRANGHNAGALSTLRNASLDLTKPITITDDYTFTFNLVKANSLFLPLISGFGIFDSTEVKKHITAADPWADTWMTTNLASFGPYMFEAFEPGQQTVQVPNPYYWAGPSDVSRATSIAVPDASNRLQSVLSGDLDIAGINLTDTKQVDASSTSYSLVNPGGSLYYVAFDYHSTLMQNANIRKAISMALDRTALNQAAYNGLATPVTGCLPTAWGTTSTSSDYTATAQVDAAKKLADTYTGDKTMSIGVTTSAAGQEEMSRIIQSNLAAIGITVSIATYSTGSTFTSDMNDHKHDAYLTARYPGVQDAGYFWQAFWQTGSVYNVTGYQSSAFDSAVASASTATAADRQQYVDAACSAVLADNPMAPIVLVGSASATSKRLTNNVQLPDGTTQLYNLKAAK